MAIDKFPYFFKKFVKSPIALMTRNQISEWAMVFRYGNFFIPRVEEISMPENRPIRKSYISKFGSSFTQFINGISHFQITVDGALRRYQIPYFTLCTPQIFEVLLTYGLLPVGSYHQITTLCTKCK